MKIDMFAHITTEKYMKASSKYASSDAMSNKIVKGQPDQAVDKIGLYETLSGNEDIGQVETQGPKEHHISSGPRNSGCAKN